MEYDYEISLPYKIDEEIKIEKVYAEKLGSYYQIKSIPAWASNVAFNDIVSVKESGGHLFFEDLIEASGHSVLHIVIFKPEVSSQIFEKLASFGLGLNHVAPNKYLVVAVPKEVPYQEVRLYINEVFNLGWLDYQEACLSDIHRENLKRIKGG